MGNKYQKNLKELVGFDQTKRILARALAREAIAPKRGISFFNADRSSVATVSGAAPTTINGVTVLGIGTNGMASFDGTLNSNTADKKVDQSAQQGGDVDPKNPFRTIYGSSENSYDAKKLIDGTDSPRRNRFDESFSGIGGLGDYSSGFLKRMTGLTDCDTGKELDIRFDGTFLPPDTWEDDGTPPAYAKWEQGTMWRGSSVGQPDRATAQKAAEAARDESGDVTYTLVQNITDPLPFPHVGGTVRIVFTFEDPSTHLTVDYYAYDITCNPGIYDDACPIENPYEVKWPEDNIMQLSFQDTKFVKSGYESEADLVARFTDNKHSVVTFCFDGGTRFGTIASTNEGGYMIYESPSQGSIAVKSGTIVRVFNSKGQISAYTDAGGIAAYNP